LHKVYWRGKLAEGKAVAFGPVADLAGGWGVGILRVFGAQEAQGLTENAPVMVADRGFRFEVFPSQRRPRVGLGVRRTSIHQQQRIRGEDQHHASSY
jgi:hypothetical protein